MSYIQAIKKKRGGRDSRTGSSVSCMSLNNHFSSYFVDMIDKTQNKIKKKNRNFCTIKTQPQIPQQEMEIAVPDFEETILKGIGDNHRKVQETNAKRQATFLEENISPRRASQSQNQ